MQLNKKKIHSALFGSSNKRIGDVEVCFIPFWVLLVSNLRSGGRANPERRQSEPRANPEWKQSTIILYQKSQKLGCRFWKKKRHKAALDNNNNNNRDETTFPSHFTLHFTNSNANTMTDSYIRPDVKCEMWNAMIFGFFSRYIIWYY